MDSSSSSSSPQFWAWGWRDQLLPTSPTSTLAATACQGNSRPRVGWRSLIEVIKVPPAPLTWRLKRSSPPRQPPPAPTLTPSQADLSHLPHLCMIHHQPHPILPQHRSTIPLPYPTLPHLHPTMPIPIMDHHKPLPTAQPQVSPALSPRAAPGVPPSPASSLQPHYPASPQPCPSYSLLLPAPAQAPRSNKTNHSSTINIYFS